ncbi:3'-5' exoribonuclease, partial [bacterium]|nr:3'-5' exoribonuclease [bacterium]
MPNHVMIDMETLATDPFCAILTIGAVKFNPKGIGVTQKLELKPTIEDQIEVYNRTINDDTLRWWSEQSPDALEEALGDTGRQSFKECMDILYKFCWNCDAVWS